MTNIKYSVIDSFLGGKVNGQSAETFDTIEAAKEWHRIEYKERSKNDGYDIYHRDKETGKHCYILQTIETVIKLTTNN